MKNHYDKALLVLALILLGLGAALFFKEGGLPADAPHPQSNVQPTGDPYTRISPPPPPPPLATWIAPKSQRLPDLRWTYGVFTPPKIWWDAANRTFYAIAPIPGFDIGDFGLEFVSVEREAYRVQLLSFGGTRVAPRLNFRSVENSRDFGAVVGQEFPELGLRIVSFSPDQVERPGGGLSEVGVVVVYDTRINKEVILRQGVTLYLDEGQRFVLRTVEGVTPPNPAWVVTKEGDSLVTDLANYEVTAVNFEVDPPTVTVRKTQPDQPARSETFPKPVVLQSIVIEADELQTEAP